MPSGINDVCGWVFEEIKNIRAFKSKAINKTLKRKIENLPANHMKSFGSIIYKTEILIERYDECLGKFNKLYHEMKRDYPFDQSAYESNVEKWRPKIVSLGSEINEAMSLVRREAIAEMNIIKSISNDLKGGKSKVAELPAKIQQFNDKVEIILKHQDKIKELTSRARCRSATDFETTVLLDLEKLDVGVESVSESMFHQPYLFGDVLKQIQDLFMDLLHRLPSIGSDIKRLNIQNESLKKLDKKITKDFLEWFPKAWNSIRQITLDCQRCFLTFDILYGDFQKNITYESQFYTRVNKWKRVVEDSCPNTMVFLQQVQSAMENIKVIATNIQSDMNQSKKTLPALKSNADSWDELINHFKGYAVQIDKRFGNYKCPSIEEFGTDLDQC